MARVLRESDKAFIEAQVLAKQLCPNCQKTFQIMLIIQKIPLNKI